MKILVAYMPVVHAGYVKVIDQYAVDEVWLIGESLQADFPELVKDLRKLDPGLIDKMLRSIGLKQVHVVEKEEISARVNSNSAAEFYFPNEELSHELVKRFWPADASIHFLDVFLRWDRSASLKQDAVHAAEVISRDDFDREIMHRAVAAATQSSDWWRQVGAVLVKDGEIVVEKFNHHLPTQQQPYIDGDPRGNFHRGENVDKSTAFHAEAAVIAESAKNGVKVAGASLYVTTFPCPSCAKLIAQSGISRLYFQDGYAMVDGEQVLAAAGVAVVKIEAAG